MDRSRGLDFVVIGTPRGGTTSLFKYLQPHERIFMPVEKEAPFFADEAQFAMGWERFWSSHFGTSTGQHLLGKVSPTYLADPRVPSRMGGAMPNTKLILLLRNPIDRAIASHGMYKRWGVETLSLEQALRDALEPAALSAARTLISHSDREESQRHIVVGEYGRCLSAYLEYYSRDNILILFTENMKSNPSEVMRRTLRFLGLDDKWKSPTLGRIFNRGGAREIVPGLGLLRRHIHQVPRLLRPWRLMPQAWRRWAWFWLQTWNVRKGSGAEIVPDDMRRRLISFYRSDVDLLVRLGGEVPPWPEFHAVV